MPRAVATGPEIAVLQRPTQALRERIIRGIRAYNHARAGHDRWQPLAVVLRHPKSGRLVGGLYADSYYEWMFVDQFWISERHRGQGWGRRLMAALEAEARRRGCRGIWLDTFSWQARGFYEKLGFRIFGAIDGYPPPHRRFYLTKRLARRRKTA